MSGRLATPLLIAIALLLPGRSSAEAAEQPGFRTWTDSTGKHQTEAAFVDYENGQVRLKKPDRTIIRIPIGNLSEADQQYVQSQYPGTLFTGCGLDPEKAKHDAFTRAIEYHVGVLVDAETRVENDELISEKILTVSKGYMERHEVVRSWQEEGLHYVLIWAVVAQKPLASQLENHQIPLNIHGEKLYRQFKFELENEKNAAEMFRNIMRRWTMDKLLVASPIAEDILGRQGNEVQWGMRIKLEVAPNAWESLRNELSSLLEMVKIESYELSSVRQTRRWNRYYSFVVDRRDLFKELAAIRARRGGSYNPLDPLAVVVLNKEISPTAAKTRWDAFVVRRSVVRQALLEAERPWYDLCIRFAEQGGEVIQEVRQPIGGLFGGEVDEEGFQWPFMARTSDSTCHFIGPLFWAIEGELDCEKDRYARSVIGDKIAKIKLKDFRDLTGYLAIEPSPVYLAAEALRGALPEFTMEKLIQVESVEDPELLEKGPTHARFHVAVRLSANLTPWQEFHGKVDRALAQTASGDVPISTVPQEDKPDGGFYKWLHTPRSNERVAEELGEPDQQVCLFRSLENPAGSETVWDMYHVDKRLIDVLDTSAATAYQLRISLLDAGGNTIKEVKRPVQPERTPITNLWIDDSGRHYLAPLLLGSSGSWYAVSAKQEETVEVERSRSPEVKTCTVIIEAVPVE